MHETTLYCFYDLAESPASYDFFTYMQLAELHRKRHNLSNLFLSLFLAQKMDSETMTYQKIPHNVMR